MHKCINNRVVNDIKRIINKFLVSAMIGKQQMTESCLILLQTALGRVHSTRARHVRK